MKLTDLFGPPTIDYNNAVCPECGANQVRTHYRPGTDEPTMLCGNCLWSPYDDFTR